MRILHVTPHLPPDQAANALLPWQLGVWARDAGDAVEYVAHPPRAGSPSALRAEGAFDRLSRGFLQALRDARTGKTRYRKSASRSN